MVTVPKYVVKDENQKTLPKAADRKDSDGRRDASARAKAIMARFPKTMARLAE